MTNYREFYKEHTADAIIAELERLALSLSEEQQKLTTTQRINDRLLAGMEKRLKASTEYAEQLKQERDDLKADYLRRHKDAVDRGELLREVLVQSQEHIPQYLVAAIGAALSKNTTEGVRAESPEKRCRNDGIEGESSTCATETVRASYQEKLDNSDFEIWIGDEITAQTCGPRDQAMAEAFHYAAVYQADGEQAVQVYEVTRRPIDQGSSSAPLGVLPESTRDRLLRNAAIMLATAATYCPNEAIDRKFGGERLVTRGLKDVITELVAAIDAEMATTTFTVPTVPKSGNSQVNAERIWTVGPVYQRCAVCGKHKMEHASRPEPYYCPTEESVEVNSET